MKRRLLAFGLYLAIISAEVLAASARPGGGSPAELGWDLTYRSVLRANHVGRGEWVAKWVRSHKGGPIDKLVENWHHDPIISSVLLDAPAFHAGERVVHFLVRTPSAAYAWVFTDGEPEESQDKRIDSGLYDELIAQLRSWEQAPPVSKQKAGDKVPPGYFGFLSLYEPGHSRQILLTAEDFLLPGDKGWEEAQDGRVPVAFGPIGETYE